MSISFYFACVQIGKPARKLVARSAASAPVKLRTKAARQTQIKIFMKPLAQHVVTYI